MSNQTSAPADGTPLTSADRELLEKAARAAGIVLQWDNEGTAWLKWPSFKWDPLADDGQALRLAVKLRMHLGVEDAAVSAWSPAQWNAWASENTLTSDSMAATRRAIVRAAAAMDTGEQQ